MPAKASDIDKVRRRCGAAALEFLASQPPDAIDAAVVAGAAKVEPRLAARLFPDAGGLIEQGLRDRDDSVLLRLAEDFASDPDASIRDKILEGLIARYECYNPLKGAIQNLSRSAARDPMLAAMLVCRLNEASKGLLSLAGVGTSGFAGMLRIKGLSGVALSCQRTWFGDTSADLAVTIRTLDNRLRQAESLARGLNILGPGGAPDPMDGENDGKQGGGPDG